MSERDCVVNNSVGSATLVADRQSGSERIVCRITAHGKTVHVFVHEDGKLTVWLTDVDKPDPHKGWEELRKDNLLTGKRWPR